MNREQMGIFLSVCFWVAAGVLAVLIVLFLRSLNDAGRETDDEYDEDRK